MFILNFVVMVVVMMSSLINACLALINETTTNVVELYHQTVKAVVAVGDVAMKGFEDLVVYLATGIESGIEGAINITRATGDWFISLGQVDVFTVADSIADALDITITTAMDLAMNYNMDWFIIGPVVVAVLVVMAVILIMRNNSIGYEDDVVAEPIFTTNNDTPAHIEVDVMVVNTGAASNGFVLVRFTDVGAFIEATRMDKNLLNYAITNKGAVIAQYSIKNK